MKIRRNLAYIWVVALMAALGLVQSSPAQVDHGPVENRFLFVFDTSSAMKKRLPAEEKAIRQLFDITLNGHIRPGDTIGVWTFNKDLHTGVLPLQRWTDNDLTSFPDALTAFVKKQRYTKDTRFDELIPALNQVVVTSPRLTTVIFCDGDGQISEIPWAPTINATFKQHQRQMEKGRVPFAIVLRSQIGPDGVGRYVGCTISSAESITLPQFPPLPAPPTPPKQAPPPPAPTVPSLIIIGTNNPATNRPPPAPVPAPAPPQQQPSPVPAPSVRPIAPAAPAAPIQPAPSPAPSVPLSTTNVVPPPAMAAPMQPTNAAIIPPQTPVPTPPAEAAQALPPQPAATSTNGLIAAGVGVLIFVIAIIFFILRRARRRNSTSLITESLKKDKIHS